LTAPGRNPERASFQPLNDLGSVVALGARRNPERIAVKEAASGRSRTYAQLDERATRLANALRGLGLITGERVAGWLDDVVEYVELYVAAAKAGLVMVPINSRLTHHEAAFQLDRTGARALVYSRSQADRVEELIGRDELALIAVVAEDRVARGRPFESLISGGSRDPLRPPAPGAPSMICFTSGTTGAPKGAVLTHRSCVTLSHTQHIALRIPMYGVNLQAVSMSFPATVVSHMMSHLVAGGTQVLAAAPWDSERLLGLIARERVTHLYVPTPVLGEFSEVADADPARWRTLTSVLHAGSRADPAVLERFAAVFGTRYTEGWGMTEISGGVATATNPMDVLDPFPGFFSSAGRAVPGSIVVAVDDERRRLPQAADAVGELAIRSASPFAGYWNDPEATAAVFDDGWYYTGDLGSVDERGYVYISDRRANMILSGGINVYPAELELVLERCPGIAECAVIGVPHPRWGQTPVAVVVKTDGVALGEEEVIGFAREHLASYKKPTKVVFVEEIPRTMGGKVARGQVRALVGNLLPGP